MFTVPAYGSLGDAGRGLLRAPGLLEWDASLVKDTKVRFLGEAGAVEFRAEFFNVINHENFAPAIGTREWRRRQYTLFDNGSS